MSSVTEADEFTDFHREVEPRLRHALCAAFGPDVGRDATAEAMAFGWEHWPRVREKSNPAGYLWGVGRNKARRMRPRSVGLPPVTDAGVPWVEPRLPEALGRLSERQRVVVMLVHGMQWTLSEVAEVLGISKTSAQNHLERGMARLRRVMGQPDD